MTAAVPNPAIQPRRYTLSRRHALIGGACLCCLPAAARATDGKIVEVAPGVFMRRGVDEDATAANLDAIANIGFIVGRDSVLVTERGAAAWLTGNGCARRSRSRPTSRSAMWC